MVTVIIRDDGEPKVIELTYENLHREIKDIAGARLIVQKRWLSDLPETPYVCFVEADCLVSSGYFSSQLGLFKKNPYFRKLAMLSSSICVNNWANRFYGYSLGDKYTDGIIPNLEKKSSQVYPVQIGYVPGAIIRVKMLHRVLQDFTLEENDLITFSATLSLAFWNQGDGNRVHINPNTSYLTTENYVNGIGKPPEQAKKLKDKFIRESI